MLALIDADIVVHRIGYTTEADSEGIARARTDDLLDSILTETGASGYECWLSDLRENNFRTLIFPAYKANRIQPRPVHYDAIKEHLVKEWGARFAYGMEADDALGIAQMAFASDNPENGATLDDVVICSIDKDLLQIPGQHYNFVKKEWTNVTYWQGLQWFYQQLLIGDTTDNVQGCRGIGVKKAEKAILPIPESAGETALLREVVRLYQKQEKGWTPEGLEKQIRLTGNLLRIKQREDEPLWDSQSLELMAELKSLFTPQKQGENSPSMEPTTPMTQNSDGFQSLGDQTVPSSETGSIPA